MEEYFFFVFKLSRSRGYYYVFYNKNTSFYHISNDFCNFQRGGPKNTKKVLNFGRLPVRQFSLDLKKFRIWATFTYIYNIV